ncbi:MAG TPA: FHA domain-containing protein [Micromonosporaceae bacterium]|nr:FHA domain-containing protein [Micromonosporaceae bacterium]
MRFEVSRVLDAIEKQLSTDPVVARAVVDLAEVLRYTDLDAGRPASLLRLGLVIDALARHLGEESVSVYVVADRAVLSDSDLTSNERMAIRRWADDGLVEVLPAAGERVFEVAELTGLPVLTRQEPGRWLAPVPGGGGAVLTGTAAAVPPPSHPALARLWQCPEADCALFGPGRTASQPPPRMRSGVPSCPRHEQRLTDRGPRPRSVPLVVRVDGVVRLRFAVSAERPVVIGREPVEDDGIRLGPWLEGEGARRVSRSHVRVALTPAGVEVTDTSTNGTILRTPAELIRVSRGETRILGQQDVVVLYDGVEIARPGIWRRSGVAEPRSVMSDAPTIAMRLPRG